MSKLAPTSIKYLIKANIKADGVVEKPDVIGAVFGQTEGLLGGDLNLRELQKTGRIGRIEVEIKSEKGSSTGEVIIPSSLDSAETALIAATLETIERVGPCTAEIKLTAVEDVREDKRKYVIDKAKEILEKMMKTGGGETGELSEEIKQSVRAGEVTELEGMTAGPDATSSQEIILVEGRADVLNLLKSGIRNSVAVGGTNVSKNVDNVCRGRGVTAFVDGDRGGQLIIKAIAQLTKIDYVAQAPEGKEVEELNQRDIFKALREKVPFDKFRDNDFKMPFSKPVEDDSNPSLQRPAEQSQYQPKENGERCEERGRGFRRDRDRGRVFGRDRRFSGRRGRDSGFGEERPAPLSDDQRISFKKMLGEIAGTGSACIYDSGNNLLGRVPLPELESTLSAVDSPYTIVIDGRVNFGLAMAAKRSGAKFLVGMESEENIRTPVKIFSKKDVE
jgi:5S rRNA maturation endonuclease (ribonuclease M5)